MWLRAGDSKAARAVLGWKPGWLKRTPERALALGGIIFVVCLLSSSLGVRAALKVEPAEALGG